MVNVGKYSSPMEHMGYQHVVFFEMCFFLTQTSQGGFRWINLRGLEKCFPANFTKLFRYLNWRYSPI